LASSLITSSIRLPLTLPGQIALTRTPAPPNSIANVFVNPITAHLAAVYGERNGNPKKEALEAILIIEGDLDFFKKLMDVNYFGAVNCVHSALPHLKKTKGVIVSCSTGQALMGFPRHSGYAASKHALHGFLSTIAIENKNQVNILEAVLGWIRGTNLRDNAYGPNGEVQKKPPKHDNKESTSLEECVSQIIFAIEKGRRTTYIPKKLKYIPFLKAFARWYLEERADKAVEKSN